MHYLDASACVALLTPESGTARVNAWRDACSDNPLAISWWVHTEVCSALSIKLRMGSLSEEKRDQVLIAWREFRSGTQILSVEVDSFTTAGELLERYDLGLRAGDALHLAVAKAHGCTLVTLDERMAKAAAELGVPVAEI